MNILAFNTIGKTCFVGLLHKDEINMQTSDIENNHSEQLVIMIEDVLAKAGIRYKDLDLIALAIGAGSFTGTRVGVAVAKGISIALGIRIAEYGNMDINDIIINAKKDIENNNFSTNNNIRPIYNE